MYKQGFAKMNLDKILNNITLANKITNFSLSVKGYKYYTKLRYVDMRANKLFTATHPSVHVMFIAPHANANRDSS